jgi:hypothetical protein
MRAEQNLQTKRRSFTSMDIKSKLNKKKKFWVFLVIINSLLYYTAHTVQKISAVYSMK